MSISPIVRAARCWPSDPATARTRLAFRSRPTCVRVTLGSLGIRELGFKFVQASYQIIQAILLGINDKCLFIALDIVQEEHHHQAQYEGDERAVEGDHEMA